jgi:maltooligosyltrehalose trehalohydrolase
MTTFRVWAPRAESVELVMRAERIAMSSEAGGWFEADVDDVADGIDYAFSIDGGDSRPDPRSPWQPEGVDGPSRTVDHSRFPWTDDRWGGVHLPSAVLYELHVGTFSEEGTFDGVIAHLDHLVDLGVDAIELLPVAEFPGERGWGYDGVDLWAPHHGYGGPEGLKRLVDACHHRGLGVILDVVYNHLGPAGNYLGEYGPYFTDRYATPWGQAVNLDGPGSDEVRRFFIDNALMWLRDYHLDGLRLDAVHAIVDTSAIHFLEQLGIAVEELGIATGRPRFLVAESDLNDPRIVRRREEGGYAMDAQWSDDFHHALHTAITGEHQGYYADFAGLKAVAKCLTDVFVYDGAFSESRDRVHGRPATGVPGWRFLAYSQNHDQVGNRAQGDRLSHLATTERLKVAAALVLCAPFVPMLFQGEEWGATAPFLYFTDHPDPELGRAVSEGRRREFSAFGWDPASIPDPQEAATFERSKLDWPERDTGAHAGLHDWYRQLIALRRSRPDLLVGDRSAVNVDCNDTEGWIKVQRGATTLACNLSSREATLTVDGGCLLAASQPGVRLDGSRLVLPPDGVAIIG